MSAADSMRRLEFARSTTFKKAYEPLEGTLSTLSDESIALLFHVAEKRLHKPEEILGELPEEVHVLFAEFQKMATVRGIFFKRFAAYVRLPADGILIGFGADDMYYVLAVWDPSGVLTWKPTQELYGEPVLA